MFCGNHLYAVDDKGRVAIPARFRDELSALQDGRLVVTRFKRRNRPCLDVFPIAEWRRFQEQLAAEKRFGRKRSAFKSWYVGAAQEVQLDAQGRLLIPPTLREYAGVGREVMIVGATEKFRIWDKDVFQQIDREDEDEVFEDPAFLDEIGL
jgi:MraZ protein